MSWLNAGAMPHPIPLHHLHEGHPQDVHGITPYFSNVLVAVVASKRIFILNA